MSEQPFTAAGFQAFLNENKLMAARSASTGALFLPPRPIDPETLSNEMEWVALSGEGKLVAYTTVSIGTTAMVEAGYGRDNPYCTGIVELAEGPRFSAQVTGVDTSDPASIRIGMPLKATFVERGEGDAKKTHLVFEPA
jgi:uncharacterized protein